MHVFTEIIVVSNTTDLHQITYSRIINTTEPSRDLKWWAIDNYRALYGIISESEAQCSIDYGYSLFSFPVDSEFINNTYSSLEFSNVIPTVLRDAQSPEITQIHVFGKGITREFTNKLKWYFTAGSEYLEITSAVIVSENVIVWDIPYDVYKFGVASKYLIFKVLGNGISPGYVLLSIKHIDKSEFIPSSKFLIVTNSVIRITSRAKIIYFDKNKQIVQVELEDSSDSLDLSSAVLAYSNSTSVPSKIYSCIFTDDTGIIQFSSSLNTDRISKIQTRGGYPDIKYYDLYWNYPNTDSIVNPTKMYISEKYIFGNLEYNFKSGSVSIVVESQPLVTNIIPSNYPHGENGTLIIEGSFDPLKTLYLRISYKDSMSVTLIPASIITPTQADFTIDSTYFKYIGLYILEISYYNDQFWDLLPWEKYTSTIDQVNQGILDFNLL